MRDLCAAGDGRPARWRGFCVVCKDWLGYARRRLIEEDSGRKERARAVAALRMHWASLKQIRKM